MMNATHKFSGTDISGSGEHRHPLEGVDCIIEKSICSHAGYDVVVLVKLYDWCLGHHKMDKSWSRRRWADFAEQQGLLRYTVKWGFLVEQEACKTDELESLE